MKKSHENIINTTLLISWLVIISVLIVTYSVEVIRHERTVTYLIQFIAVMLVPWCIVAFIYHVRPDWQKLGYAIVTGYSVMYVFVIFTGSTQMVSIYVLPLLCFLVLYHMPWLIVYSFSITMVANIIMLFKQISDHTIASSNVKEVEIRFAALIICYAGSYFSTRLYGQIYDDNRRYNNELTEKNEKIQDMALQTIATIANAIDAKDEYTRGHSSRVSEYSVAIARELGMSDNKILELRSIALLHDIGKIGVPDSVLNKPGKLTDIEFELMKQHTIMGADILKDISMIAGIDVGAKYHHERYDGTGYPDKLVGENIPKIARIIAVADALDAMTSNRVYRSHLDMDHVLAEFRRCRGTQFDPELADIVVNLLEGGKLRLIPIDSPENNELSEVSKIWYRVMETGEQKYKDRSVVDELTGLYTRNFGEKLIREAVEKGKGALIVVDLDHFRKVNAAGGFLLGDIFLRTVASFLGSVDETKIMARYGGDEFVMFLPDVVDKDSIIRIASALVDGINQQNRQLNEPVRLTVSLGIYVCSETTNAYQDAFLNADRALYYSKRNGGNCYTFFEKNLSEQLHSDKENIDLLKLKDTISNPEKYDAYINGSPEFRRAYDLLKQLIDDNQVPLQMVLFTASPNENSSTSLEEQLLVTDYLEKAISRSIKGKDFTFKYSSTQRMIILTESGEEGAHAVSTHIIKEFYKFYSQRDFNVSYSTIEIS